MLSIALSVTGGSKCLQPSAEFLQYTAWAKLSKPKLCKSKPMLYYMGRSITAIIIDIAKKKKAHPIKIHRCAIAFGVGIPQ